MLNCVLQEAGPIQVLLVPASRPSQTSLGCRAKLPRRTASLTRHKIQDVPHPTAAAATKISTFCAKKRQKYGLLLFHVVKMCFCVKRGSRVLAARSRRKLEQMELMLLTHSPDYRLELHSPSGRVRLITMSHWFRSTFRPE